MLTYAVCNMKDEEDIGEDDEDLSDSEHALAFEDEVEDDPNDEEDE